MITGHNHTSPDWTEDDQEASEPEIKPLEKIIDWEAVRCSDPMQEVLNIVRWLKDRGFNAWHQVTERDSFGPLCVLISAVKDGEKYEYLY